MALKRPFVDTRPGRITSVVLGTYEGPYATTYYTTYELNKPRNTLRIRERFQLQPSEIFHKSKYKCPFTEHQVSFGIPPDLETKRDHELRMKEASNIMGTQLLKSVPIGRSEHKLNSYRVNTTQMKTDYSDRQSALHYWTKIQRPNLPKYPPIKKLQPKKGHLRWYGMKSEAAHQFHWPGFEEPNINQVKYIRNYNNL